MKPDLKINLVLFLKILNSMAFKIPTAMCGLISSISPGFILEDFGYLLLNVFQLLPCFSDRSCLPGKLWRSVFWACAVSVDPV